MTNHPWDFPKLNYVLIDHDFEPVREHPPMTPELT